jgi:hypothetical protein
MTTGVRGAPAGLRSTASVPRNHQAGLVACSLAISRWTALAGFSVMVMVTSGYQVWVW